MRTIEEIIKDHIQLWSENECIEKEWAIACMKEYSNQWKKVASALYVATENTINISEHIIIEMQYAMAQYRNMLLNENVENI